jgi:L-lysine 6-transaminase
MTASTLTPISPAEVHGILARHMLADGYDIVFDFERSRGAWVHDSRAGRDYLDFCTFFASNPVGYNHPKMQDQEE